MLSKRKLLELVEGGHVDGWDDPRMPTLVGMRRRGYPPAAIRDFCDRIGIAKANSIVQVEQLEDAVRQELNRTAQRVLAVRRPLRVVIENYPQDQVEELEAVNNPEDAAAGTRKLPFSRVLYIERDDFREDPPRKYFRLAPGREVRLRYAYFIKCVDLVQGPAERRGGGAPLHVRPGDARWLRTRRAQGARHHPLGVSRARHRGRGAAVRPSLLEGEPGRPGRGRGLQGPP